MEKEKFEKIVEEALKSIPKRFLNKLDNVDIVIQERPTSYQLRKIKKGNNILLFGLYEGVPQTKRRHYGQVLPDKITIFKESIKKVARTEEEIKEKVRKVVWHEIAHHFGMSEERVRRAEKRKS